MAVILNVENVKVDWSNPDYCLAAVTKNGESLKNVINQTEAICDAAVNQIPTAIRYVTNKTKNQILTALYQDGMLLRFIDDQSDPDIVNAAINQNSFSIQHVKPEYQSELMALSCVSQDGMILRHVAVQTEAICVAAFKQNRYSYELVKDMSLRKALEEHFHLV